MIKKLKPKSEFSKNVLTLMTGTTIAQAIPIAISPILTRLYTPEDFGVFALFVSMSSIFGTLVNGRYELAIMLPKKDEDAIQICALGFIITFCLSLFLLILIFVFHPYLTTFLDYNVGFWLYFVPITVFFTGTYNVLNYFYNRHKLYKDVANATIFKSIVLAIMQLSIGALKGGVLGLIGGQLVSQIFINVKLFKQLAQNKFTLKKISKNKMLALAKRYKDFPKFSMPAALANALSYHLTNILISSFYTILNLGFYSLTQKVLGIPSALIGNSIGQVYFQQATIERQDVGHAINSFKTTLKKLFLISCSFFLILFFVVEDLFALVFGEEWRVAGIYTKILIPMFCVSFISAPLSITMTVFEKQINSLMVNMILIVSSMGVILLCYYTHSSFENFLKVFSTIMSINYLIFIFYYQRIAEGSKRSCDKSRR